MQRRTRQRDSILDALRRTDRPLSPREILAEASKSVPQLGIATVYRHLTGLLAARELREVTLPGEPSRYELAGKGHHHHFRCRRCDRVFELDRCPGNFKSLAPTDFLVEDHDLLLTGLCPSCRSVTA